MVSPALREEGIIVSPGFMRIYQRYLPARAIVMFWLVALHSARALDPTHDKILYMVATAHLDDQWNWTIQDTINSFIPNTLHQNFAYFTNPNYTNYTFSFEE